jgi:hypothetical protein
MTIWRVEGWPTADEWQAAWAFATFVVAGVAAWFALRQYRASVRSHIEQARPYVTVDFSFIRGGAVSLEVKNYGLTAAEAITFDWSERPVARDARAQGAIDRALVDGGIAFLAPGRAIRFYLSEFDESTSPRSYRVSAKYKGSGDGELWVSNSTLDLDQWEQALADRDPYETLAKPLRDLASEARRRNRGGIGPSFQDQAAESLNAYLAEKPAVKRYRENRAREITEQNQRVAEMMNHRSVTFASEDGAAVPVTATDPDTQT